MAQAVGTPRPQSHPLYNRVQANPRSLQEALAPLPIGPRKTSAAAAAENEGDDESDEELQVTEHTIVQRKGKQAAEAAWPAASSSAPREQILFKSQQPQPPPHLPPSPVIPSSITSTDSVAPSLSSSVPHESPNLQLGPPLEPTPFATHPPASAPARLQPHSHLSHSQPTPSRRLHHQLKTQQPHKVPFSLDHKSFRRGFVQASPFTVAAAAAESASKPAEDDERSVGSSTKDDQDRSAGALEWSQSSDDVSLPFSPTTPDAHDPATFSKAQQARLEAAYEEALLAQEAQKHNRSLRYEPAFPARTLKALLQYSIHAGLMRESEAFHPSLHAQMRRERAHTMENRPQPNLDQKMRPPSTTAAAGSDEGESEYLAPVELERQKRAQEHGQQEPITPARAVTYDLSQSQDSDGTYAPTPQPRRRKHRNEQPRSRQLAEAFASGHD